VVFSLLLAAPGAFAATAKKQNSTFQDTVTAVTASSITIKTGRNAGTKVTHVDDLEQGEGAGPSNVETLKIDSFTRITVDDLPGTAADIKPGMAVEATLGMDRDVAGSLDVHTIPPPIKPAAKPASKTAAAKTGQKKGGAVKQAFRKIGSDEVLAVTSTRITVGQPGSKTARAYYLTAMTTVTIDGASASAGDLREGMDVVVSGDATTAEQVEAHNKQ
jgi:hypothetical protein